MKELKSPQKIAIWRRLVAGQLILAIWCSFTSPAYSAGPATTGDVSVEGNSAAISNINRVMQSPDARPANAPTRSGLQSQPTIVLPDMGDPGGDALSRVDERKYGEMIMRQIRPDADYSNDLPIYDYLNQMERRLLQAAKKLQLGGANEQGSGAYNFELFAVKDSSINAFALPGGFIGFHTGLIVSAESDSEVASVMGHETGHVLQRHLARQMDKQTTNTMIAIAGMVLGALAMSRNPQAAAGLMQGGQAAAINNQLSYSRDAEREAELKSILSKFAAETGSEVADGLLKNWDLSRFTLVLPRDYAKVLAAIAEASSKGFSAEEVDKYVMEAIANG